MKKIKLTPYRKYDKRFKLKKFYIVKIKKGKNSGLIIPVPDDIVKAYHIEVEDVAIFEVVDKNKFRVRFVRNSMYSFVDVNKNLYK